MCRHLILSEIAIQKFVLNEENVGERNSLTENAAKDVNSVFLRL